MKNMCLLSWPTREHARLIARTPSIEGYTRSTIPYPTNMKTLIPVQYLPNSHINPYKPSVLFEGQGQTVQTQTRRRLVRVFTVCLQNILFKIEYKLKDTANTTKIGNGLVLLIEVGKSIRLNWVKNGCRWRLRPLLWTRIHDCANISYVRPFISWGKLSACEKTVKRHSSYFPCYMGIMYIIWLLRNGISAELNASFSDRCMSVVFCVYYTTSSFSYLKELCFDQSLASHFYWL